MHLGVAVMIIGQQLDPNVKGGAVVLHLASLAVATLLTAPDAFMKINKTLQNFVKKLKNL